MITNYLNQIIRGDCVEVLKQLPSESVDCVFADPPFNIGKKYSQVRDKKNDYKEWSYCWIAECFRVLKKTGSIYLMTLPRYLEWQMPIMASMGVFINLISWRNVSAAHNKKCFWGEYQPIMLYGKTEQYIFNTYAETEETNKRRWGGYSTEYKGQLKDRLGDIPFVYAGSIKHKEAIIEPGTNRKKHPCQMPEKLAFRAIKFSTNIDNIVLDPFVGSGTVPKVCRENNRNFIGIELSPEYCKMAINRILSV